MRDDGDAPADLARAIDLSIAGVDQNLGNVDEIAFDDTGNRLAYTVDAADREGNIAAEAPVRWTAASTPAR